MEDKLKKLFEYQKFAQNARLAAVINNAEKVAVEAFELSDDELFGVAGGKGQEKSYEEIVREQQSKH